MATPILEAKGIELHTFFNVETIDPERKVVRSLEGEELRTTCSSSSRRTRASSS